MEQKLYEQYLVGNVSDDKLYEKLDYSTFDKWRRLVNQSDENRNIFNKIKKLIINIGEPYSARNKQDMSIEVFLALNKNSKLKSNEIENILKKYAQENNVKLPSNIGSKILSGLK